MKVKSLVFNRSVLHNYEILKKYEAGISLLGWEVKSVKSGQIELKGSYVKISKKNSLFLINSYVKPYEFSSNINEKLFRRDRQLLLKRLEINKIINKMNEKGLTLIPLEVYINEKGLIKIEICLVRGKKKYDKREIIKKRYNYKEISNYI